MLFWSNFGFSKRNFQDSIYKVYLKDFVTEDGGEFNYCKVVFDKKVSTREID